MPRICRFSHLVLENDEKCHLGHYLATTLECSVAGCRYITRPVNLELLKYAVEQLKLHMIGAHPHIKDKVKETEDTEEEDITSKRKKEVDPNEKLTCPQCYKMFCSKKNVKRHVQYEHERKDRLHCTSCNKTYASKTALTYHMKKFHSDSSGMKCDGCDEIFLEFKKFKDHIKIHRKKSSKKADHRCDECHATFSDKSNLNRHMSDIHSTSNFNTEKITVKAFPFQCEQCKFITKRKHYFEIHKIKQHGLDDKEDSPPENDS